MNAFVFVVRSNYWHCFSQNTRQFVNFVMLVKHSDTLVLNIFFLKGALKLTSIVFY
jgi:hypothetical protein